MGQDPIFQVSSLPPSQPALLIILKTHSKRAHSVPPLTPLSLQGMPPISSLDPISARHP